MFKVKIEIKDYEFTRGTKVTKALVVKRDEENVSILINGSEAPRWATNYALNAAEAGEPAAHIADTIMKAYDYSQNGKVMKSRYDGRCAICGEEFEAGTQIYYTFDSKAALQEVVEAVLTS